MPSNLYEYHNDIDDSEDFTLMVAVKYGTRAEADKAKTRLWLKYERLRMKMRGDCASRFEKRGIMRDSYESFIDDYDGRAAIKFEEAIAGVKVFEHENPDHPEKTWEHLRKKAQLYQQFWGYLSAMNRDIVKEWFVINTGVKAKGKDGIKTFAGFTSIHELSRNDGKGESKSTLTNLDAFIAQDWQDDADRMYNNTVRQIFSDAIIEVENRLKRPERRIWNAVKEGKSIGPICQEEHITKELGEQFLDIARDEVMRTAERLSREYGQPMTFEEISEALAA
jgi:hypothetical protein